MNNVDRNKWFDWYMNQMMADWNQKLDLMGVPRDLSAMFDEKKKNKKKKS